MGECGVITSLACAMDLRAASARTNEIDGPLSLSLQLHDGSDVDRLLGRELPQGERLVLLHRLHDLRGLARLSPSQIRGLEAASVIFVLSLALLVGGFGMRRTGRARVTLQLRNEGCDDFLDDGVLVQN
jgi:hypothetical protein